MCDARAGPRTRPARLQYDPAHRAIAGATLDHYHWHLELLPRIAGVAGFEWATGYHINAVLPEESARRLRDNLD